MPACQLKVIVFLTWLISLSTKVENNRQICLSKTMAKPVFFPRRFALDRSTLGAPLGRLQGLWFGEGPALNCLLVEQRLADFMAVATAQVKAPTGQAGKGGRSVSLGGVGWVSQTPPPRDQGLKLESVPYHTQPGGGVEGRPALYVRLFLTPGCENLHPNTPNVAKNSQN